MRIVQKFGGTSVGSPERIEAVADIVRKATELCHEVVVVVSAMGDTTDELIALAHQIDPRPSARELDALMATGEQVSAALVAIALQKRAIKARSLTGWQAGVATEPVHGAARVSSIAAEKLEQVLADGEVPVVTGFQGIAGGEITTLGRGGSDTSAVALAAVLKADLCEIYTDVTGVFTTDPRLVAAARKLPQVSYDEMLELANLGAQVLHPRAVENAKQFGVPLVVRSSFTDEEGTVIVDGNNLEQRHVVTGIAFEPEVARVALIGVAVQRHGLAAVFTALARAGVNVDVIVQSVVQSAEVDVSFTVKEEDADLTLGIVRGLRDELGYRDLVCESGLAKVSIVGAGMISNPGVAAQMFQALADLDIPIRMVSTSEIKVSCIIPAAHMEASVLRLHAEFLESEARVAANS
ncbi:MAG: aspartate kinase [Alicyclobacillus sp.]|nr:aspartate kinase [Alicyclobacillus sp.]